MFNFHGGTVIATPTFIFLQVVGTSPQYALGYNIVLIGFVLLAFVTTFLLLATLVRFILNFRKHGAAFYQIERIPSLD